MNTENTSIEEDKDVSVSEAPVNHPADPTAPGTEAIARQAPDEEVVVESPEGEPEIEVPVTPASTISDDPFESEGQANAVEGGGESTGEI